MILRYQYHSIYPEKPHLFHPARVGARWRAANARRPRMGHPALGIREILQQLQQGLPQQGLGSKKPWFVLKGNYVDLQNGWFRMVLNLQNGWFRTSRMA